MIKLVKDPNDRSKIDGVSHIPWGVGFAFISFILGYFWIGFITTFTIAFGSEVYQEYHLKKWRKAYPWNPFKWSQNRHQDVCFFVGAYLAIYLLLFTIRGLS